MSNLGAKMDTVESQCTVLRQAIGTMADAVADEIDEMRHDLLSAIDSRIHEQSKRVDEIDGKV